VNVLIGIEHFAVTGGAASYALVLAQHLQRIGHEVAIVTPDAGETAQHARRSGVTVTSPARAPASPAAIVASDAMISLELAARFREVPQLFVAHGAEIDNAMPAQLPGVVSTAVAMNDRVERRLRALGTPLQVVRLRQPVDRQRFRVRRMPSARARRVLLLGNYLRGTRRDLVVRACERAGLECVEVGRHSGTESPSPEGEIAAADIVVGYGRVVLEALASARAAYVFDQRAADGWVTVDRYPALERDGFAGTAFDDPIDERRLVRDLASYDAGLALAGRELVLRHHDAFRHATEVAGLLKRLPARAAPARETLLDVARLTRDKWHSDWRVIEIARELEGVQERLHAAEERAVRAERTLAELVATRRYRAAAALAAPLDRLRRRSAQ
jgi:hypothetical protein